MCGQTSSTQFQLTRNEGFVETCIREIETTIQIVLNYNINKTTNQREGNHLHDVEVRSCFRLDALGGDGILKLTSVSP